MKPNLRFSLQVKEIIWKFSEKKALIGNQRVNSFTEGVGSWVLWPCSRAVVDNTSQILPLNKATRVLFVNSYSNNNSVLLTYSQHVTFWLVSLSALKYNFQYSHIKMFKD